MVWWQPLPTTNPTRQQGFTVRSWEAPEKRKSPLWASSCPPPEGTFQPQSVGQTLGLTQPSNSHVLTSPLSGFFPVEYHKSKHWSQLMSQWWLKACGCSKHPSIPGADGHLLWIMDVGAVLPSITLAKAVVVHTVLLLLLFLLLGLTNDGQTPLNSTAKQSKTDRLW